MRIAWFILLPLLLPLLVAAPVARAAGADLPSTAAAQQTPPTNSSPSPSPSPGKPAPGSPAPPNLERIKPGEAVGVLGKQVDGPAGEDMGQLVDVIVDNAGRPVAAVIDFGGFLGVGSRKIAVDWRLLEFRPGAAKAQVRLHLDRAMLQAAPEYKVPADPSRPIDVVGPPPSAGSLVSPNAER